ncbi:2-polyprenyl-6-hydroxyphenyl methylase/3-demethylubiquinone-9 3-methyltransferase [Methylomarinovum tepidoasis]|uniref:Ubiquinone biosynthesis O-methyltransferase n=1 Tax=Methylomarinovum tepidoasis TaxID=2840183 RepID=A0AAU9C5E2_9GAMM|nr:bifunctional 2-polyprenyl-6-hydroxyphenol methylase/3-demethylubiquinol 3-O-methyltransferase UbiG [Methylomarinovum sp. IN45]BCX88384.1 2-polyprenyl-6-hydroxyphenyl methylase/3-demethylubiquinone-9 3-methyltransferase [Methylomarinovum sp. IN45]
MPQENVHPEEIAKFTSKAERWWDPEGELWTLHRVNPLRIQFIRETAAIEDKRIVDVGCGGGILSEALAKAGAAEVLGIDLSAELIDVAELHALEQGVDNVKYERISAEALAEHEPESFDLVTCMEMLEHVPRPASVVAACARLAKPGGKVFFSTLNRNLKSYLLAIVGAEYVLGMIPKGTHEYEKFIRPSELAAWARAVDLEPVAIRGIEYNPLTKRFSLSDDIDVNYLMAFEKAP